MKTDKYIDYKCEVDIIVILLILLIILYFIFIFRKMSKFAMNRLNIMISINLYYTFAK